MMRTDALDGEFDNTIGALFDHEKRQLRSPADLRANVLSAIDTIDPGKPTRRGLRIALAVAAALLAIAAIGAASAVIVREVRHEGEHVGAHTFERAPQALEDAIAILPYRVDLPTYIPQDLHLYVVGAQYTTMSIGYTPTSKGSSWQPYLGITWLVVDKPKSQFPPDFEEHEDSALFEAGGYAWSTRIYHRRDGDSLEAVTTREDGVRVFVELRVAGGWDVDQTLAELKKVVRSMEPADGSQPAP